jgi:hypothetical protein
MRKQIDIKNTQHNLSYCKVKLYEINNCEQFVRSHGKNIHVTFTFSLPFYVFIQNLEDGHFGPKHVAHW